VFHCSCTPCSPELALVFRTPRDELRASTICFLSRWTAVWRARCLRCNALNPRRRVVTTSTCSSFPPRRSGGQPRAIRHGDAPARRGGAYCGLRATLSRDSSALPPAPASAALRTPRRDLTGAGGWGCRGRWARTQLKFIAFRNFFVSAVTVKAQACADGASPTPLAEPRALN